MAAKLNIPMPSLEDFIVWGHNHVMAFVTCFWTNPATYTTDSNGYPIVPGSPMFQKLVKGWGEALGLNPAGPEIRRGVMTFQLLQLLRMLADNADAGEFRGGIANAVKQSLWFAPLNWTRRQCLDHMKGLCYSQYGDRDNKWTDFYLAPWLCGGAFSLRKSHARNPQGKEEWDDFRVNPQSVRKDTRPADTEAQYQARRVRALQIHECLFELFDNARDMDVFTGRRWPREARESLKVTFPAGFPRTENACAIRYAPNFLALFKCARGKGPWSDQYERCKGTVREVPGGWDVPGAPVGNPKLELPVGSTLTGGGAAASPSGPAGQGRGAAADTGRGSGAATGRGAAADTGRGAAADTGRGGAATGGGAAGAPFVRVGDCAALPAGYDIGKKLFRKGSPKSAEICQIQAQLNAIAQARGARTACSPNPSDWPCTVTVDSDFGARTEAAVKGFQKQAGMTGPAIDGKVGKDTWVALFARPAAAGGGGAGTGGGRGRRPDEIPASAEDLPSGGAGGGSGRDGGAGGGGGRDGGAGGGGGRDGGAGGGGGGGREADYSGGAGGGGGGGGSGGGGAVSTGYRAPPEGESFFSRYKVPLLVGGGLLAIFAVVAMSRRGRRGGGGGGGGGERVIKGEVVKERVTPLPAK